MSTATLTGATFRFRLDGKPLSVEFRGDVVRVRFAGRACDIGNRRRKYGGRPWKPCAAHAIEAIRLAAGQPASLPRALKLWDGVATCGE